MAYIHPIDALHRTHMDHARLCDQLELIADSLPGNVDGELCRTVVGMLSVEVPVHHRDEEEGLFPLLANRALPEDDIEIHLDQLQAEHITDEGVASELIEFLPGLAEGKNLRDPDLCGYVLRCFFESYRRHLFWEQNLILPLARKRLEAADLQLLNETMAAHRRMIGT